MGLKVTRQTDLTSLFDKFASIPGDREKMAAEVKETAEKLKETESKTTKKK
ncbi:SPJ_0845 family protein [Latilactobacillus sakei]|uniref:SPJ_0845 family protein n=1 Tax=Latilactobacillus sakei TaxID=1599 RepID=UPI003F52DE18